MKTHLLLAAAVLASQPGIAGGFLDIGHLDWGLFLVSSHAYNPASPPKPDGTGSVPVTDPRALPLPDQPASAEASHPITRFPSTTGAPRQITPGVSP